jgi:hypothetical protein
MASALGDFCVSITKKSAALLQITARFLRIQSRLGYPADTPQAFASSLGRHWPPLWLRQRRNEREIQEEKIKTPRKEAKTAVFSSFACWMGQETFFQGSFFLAERCLRHFRDFDHPSLLSLHPSRSSLLVAWARIEHTRRLFDRRVTVVSNLSRYRLLFIAGAWLLGFECLFVDCYRQVYKFHTIITATAWYPAPFPSPYSVAACMISTSCPERETTLTRISAWPNHRLSFSSPATHLLSHVSDKSLCLPLLKCLDDRDFAHVSHYAHTARTSFTMFWRSTDFQTSWALPVTSTIARHQRYLHARWWLTISSNLLLAYIMGSSAPQEKSGMDVYIAVRHPYVPSTPQQPATFRCRAHASVYRGFPLYEKEPEAQSDDSETASSFFCFVHPRRRPYTHGFSQKDASRSWIFPASSTQATVQKASESQWVTTLYFTALTLWLSWVK